MDENKIKKQRKKPGKKRKKKISGAYKQKKPRSGQSKKVSAEQRGAADRAKAVRETPIFIENPTDEYGFSEDLGAKEGDPDFDFFETKPETPVSAKKLDDENSKEIIGVRFNENGKVYFFDPAGIKANPGDFVIVETARGQEYGMVAAGNMRMENCPATESLRPILRVATEEDARHDTENRKSEKEAYDICKDKIKYRGLNMKLVDVRYTFDNSKLLFYFTSSERVDFRELVKDLAAIFRTRIELRQIGARYEARMLGGIGPCGRALCCSSFLPDFAQVSIKMAKEQNIALNANKISGVCGRLMCCLRYEHAVYEEEIKKTPPAGATVDTPDGKGVVTETNPLAGTIKVKLDEDQGIPVIKQYCRDDVKVVSLPGTFTEEQNVETEP